MPRSSALALSFSQTPPTGSTTAKDSSWPAARLGVFVPRMPDILHRIKTIPSIAEALVETQPVCNGSIIIVSRTAIQVTGDDAVLLRQTSPRAVVTNYIRPDQCQEVLEGGIMLKYVDGEPTVTSAKDAICLARVTNKAETIVQVQAQQTLKDGRLNLEVTERIVASSNESDAQRALTRARNRLLTRYGPPSFNDY